MGVKEHEMPFLPLTLTLSPKGRGEISFDNKTLAQGGAMTQPVILEIFSDYI